MPPRSLRAGTRGQHSSGGSLGTQHRWGSEQAWSLRCEGVKNANRCGAVCTQQSWEYLHTGPVSHF